MRLFRKNAAGLIAHTVGCIKVPFVSTVANPDSENELDCRQTFFVRGVAATKCPAFPLPGCCPVSTFGIRTRVCPGTVIFVVLVIPVGGSVNVDVALTITNNPSWTIVFDDGSTRVWAWVEMVAGGSVPNFPGDISWSGVEGDVRAWVNNPDPTKCTDCSIWAPQVGGVCATVFSSTNTDPGGRLLSKADSVALNESKLSKVVFDVQPVNGLAGIALTTFRMRIVDRNGGSPPDLGVGSQLYIVPQPSPGGPTAQGSLQLENLDAAPHFWNTEHASCPLDQSWHHGSVDPDIGTAFYHGNKVGAWTYEFPDVKILREGTYRFKVRPGRTTSDSGLVGNWAYSNPFTVEPGIAKYTRILDTIVGSTVNAPILFEKNYPRPHKTNTPTFDVLALRDNVQVEVLDNPGRGFYNRVLDYTVPVFLRVGGTSRIPSVIYGETNFAIPSQGVAEFPALKLKALGFQVKIWADNLDLTPLPGSEGFPSPRLYCRLVEFPTTKQFVGQKFRIVVHLVDQDFVKLTDIPSPLDNVRTFHLGGSLSTYSLHNVQKTPVANEVIITDARLLTAGLHKIGARGTDSNYITWVGYTPNIEVIVPTKVGVLDVEKLGGLSVRASFAVTNGVYDRFENLNWGDGSDLVNGSGSPTQPHIYAAPGTFTVSADIFAINNEYAGFKQKQVTVP